MIRTIVPGEKGVDFSYTKPPPQLLIDKGYTFCAGYSSFNPGKNCLKPQDYIDAGLAYFDLWEVNQTRCSGGYDLGAIDGLSAMQQAETKGVPQGVALIACCDTNSTVLNIDAHTRYMYAFESHNTLYGMGAYLDTDLGEAIKNISSLSILPSAWYWSNPIPRLPKETDADYYKRGQAGAELKAFNLGYKVLQRSSFKIDNLYPVDPLFCINPFEAWGNPITESYPMEPYVFQLANGGFGIRHEAGSRSMNDGEKERPYKDEKVWQIPKDSNWEFW